jgi:hypothetical protein
MGGDPDLRHIATRLTNRAPCSAFSNSSLAIKFLRIFVVNLSIFIVKLTEFIFERASPARPPRSTTIVSALATAATSKSDPCEASPFGSGRRKPGKLVSGQHPEPRCRGRDRARSPGVLRWPPGMLYFGNHKTDALCRKNDITKTRRITSHQVQLQRDGNYHKSNHRSLYDATLPFLALVILP